MIDSKVFVARAAEIAAENPGYQEGHWGKDGLCDCIGLIIGAIRRAGGTWAGTHGSNYAYRNEMSTTGRIAGTGDLQIGEVVYKAREPGDARYDLPAKYQNSGDLRDYYHVGVVVSVYPLRILHMTSPRAKTDTRIGKWSYHGKLKKIDYDGNGGGGSMQPNQTATVTLPAGSRGSSVNLRECAEGKIIARIPVGTTVEVIQDQGTWAEIRVNGNQGWMMSNYIEYPGGGEEISGDILTAEERGKIDNYLADIENRLEKIRTILGRG